MKKVNIYCNKLIAKPHTLNIGSNEISYPIYMESENKLYELRYFGIKYFGFPKKYKNNNREYLCKI